MKLGKGKGRKRKAEINGFDLFTIVDNPPPEALVKLRAERYRLGLDIWTGAPQEIEPLTQKTVLAPAALEQWEISGDEVD